MIERNTTIPTKKSQSFSTAADNQPAVDIVVLQGERPMSQDNKILGTFKLDGIAPAPRGMPQIEVTFDIDANGILNVTAKDTGTGKDQKITISGSSSLDESEVERLRKEAEKFAEDDKLKKDLVVARNDLDTMVYQAEKQVSELGEKLPDEVKKPVGEAVSNAKKVLEDQDADADRLKQAKDELMQSLEALGKQVYQNEGGEGEPAAAAAGATAASGSAESGGGKDDDIVEADFEVVDEEKDKS